MQKLEKLFSPWVSGQQKPPQKPKRKEKENSKEKEPFTRRVNNPTVSPHLPQKAPMLHKRRIKAPNTINEGTEQSRKNNAPYSAYNYEPYGKIQILQYYPRLSYDLALFFF